MPEERLIGAWEMEAESKPIVEGRETLVRQHTETGRGPEQQNRWVGVRVSMSEVGRQGPGSQEGG